MSSPAWKHTVITTDGDVTSESWMFQGVLFRGTVTYDPKQALWVGKLHWMVKELFAPHKDDVEVSRQTSEGAREAVEILTRHEWLKMPEAKWLLFSEVGDM